MFDFIQTELDAESWVKARTSTDGRQSFIVWKGSIYAFEPGKPKQHLFQIVGMSVARCLANSDGSWQFTSRELNFYLDPSSGEKLDSWENPWTGEVLPVAHVANNPVQRRFKNSVPAIVAGDMTTFVVDVFPLYPNPLASDARLSVYSPQPIYEAAEMFKLTVPTAELQDPEITSVSQMMLNWHRIGPWLPWMKMSDRPGNLVYSAWGGKVAGFRDLPQLLQDEINTRLPLYKNAPACKLGKEDITSWNYFKKHFDAYRRAEIFPIPEREAS